MNKLLNLVNELENKIPYSENLDLSISKASVGWHIEHTLLAAIQIIEAIEKSDPRDYVWKFNLKKILVFSLNKIPRGKGKAPKSVQPQGVIINEQLDKNIQILKTKLTVLQGLQPGNYFNHPYFGSLNLKSTIRMLNIHTKHHLEIINEIIKASLKIQIK